MLTKINLWLMLLLSLSFGNGAPAGAQPPGSQLVRLHNRVFNIGVDAAMVLRDPEFIPVTDIPWLRPIFDSDPMFKGVIFHIELAPMDPAHLWSPTYPDPNNKYDTNVPGALMLEGYKVFADTPLRDINTEYKFLPTTPGADYSFICQLPKRGWDSLGCTIYASYPPDKMLFLKVRVYFPRPFLTRITTYGDLVVAARDIAYCLDVTDGPKPFPRDAADKPIVKSCAPALTN